VEEEGGGETETVLTPTMPGKRKEGRAVFHLFLYSSEEASGAAL